MIFRGLVPTLIDIFTIYIPVIKLQIDFSVILLVRRTSDVSFRSTTKSSR